MKQTCLCFCIWPRYSPQNPFSSLLNNIRLSPQSRPSHYPLLPFPFSLSANSLALLFTEPNNTLQCFHHQKSVFPWHCSDFFFLLQQIHFSPSFSSSHTDLCWTKHLWEDGSLALFFTEQDPLISKGHAEHSLASCWALGVTLNITNNVFYMMNKYGRKGCCSFLPQRFELEHSWMQEQSIKMHHKVTEMHSPAEL